MKIVRPKTLKLLLIFSILLNNVFAGYSTGQIIFKKEQNKLNQFPAANYPIENKWNGFKITAFKFDGVDAKIVFPGKGNQEKNWIWRTQFWETEPQVDIALLNKGFHLVYIDVSGLYGNKTAAARFDDFYKYIIKTYGLNKKTVLEGMSRGGLDAYNWGSQNTGKVFCIYADAPVCDIKSWPGGQGEGDGSLNDWELCLKVYGLTELTVKDFKDIPIYNCIKLAKAKVPVLHVCGDSDTTVPIEENTNKLAEEYRKAGGVIQIIIKKGAGHHPHSLKDPKPIVDFILDNTGNKK